MTRVLLCSAAKEDYADALRWYADRSIDAANSFDQEVDRVLSLIASHPEQFPAADHRHRYVLLRRFPFRIIYRQAGEDIVVIAIAHGSRTADYWQGR